MPRTGHDVLAWAWFSEKTLIWGALLLLITYLILPRIDNPEIFLNAAIKPSLVVTGVVTFQGVPVKNGTVRISLSDSPSGLSYLGGVTVAVTEQA